MVQNVWDNLTTLSEKDPEKYSEIVRQSAEDVKKAKTLPIPQFCLKTRTDQVRMTTNAASMSELQFPDLISHL